MFTYTASRSRVRLPDLLRGWSRYLKGDCLQWIYDAAEAARSQSACGWGSSLAPGDWENKGQGNQAKTCRLGDHHDDAWITKINVHLARFLN